MNFSVLMLSQSNEILMTSETYSFNWKLQSVTMSNEKTNKIWEKYLFIKTLHLCYPRASSHVLYPSSGQSLNLTILEYLIEINYSTFKLFTPVY